MPCDSRLGAAKASCKVVQLEPASGHDLPLLAGPLETVTMKSGLVTLPSGQSVGKHSAEAHEEMLVILEGKGEVKFEDGAKLPDHILYCPPQTTHDVTNTAVSYVTFTSSPLPNDDPLAPSS